MNTSKLFWAASAAYHSPDARGGGASWAQFPASLAACLSSQQQKAVQNMYRLAYARAQAQVTYKQEQFRELIADVDFEHAAQEQRRFRELTQGLDFGDEL